MFLLSRLPALRSKTSAIALHRLRQLHISPAAAAAEEQGKSAPKLIVFGGRGFVGSHICKEALATGLGVISISKSGTPPITEEPWTRNVEWVRGNVLEPPTYQEHLPGAVAAISCIGGFGSKEEMLRVNGTANVTAIEQCKAAGIPRFVLISATIPKIPGLDMVVGGYIEGKAMAEEALQRLYGDAGVALRPSIIYGDRVISHNLTLPLGVVFQPLEMALSYAPKSLVDMPVIGGLFVPPVSVKAVARAAVQAATDSGIPGGIMDVEKIKKYK